MHPTLSEILENTKPGLLWVNKDATVRYANQDASERTGLAAGRRIADAQLARMVPAVVESGKVGAVQMPGVPPELGGPAPTLECRVLPGFSKDDAFVLIALDASKDKDVAFDNLMQVIKADLRDPLREAQDRMARIRELRKSDQPDPVDPLLEKTQEVLNLLDRVADLAAIWGSGALLDNDRIELWPMLLKAWNKVEPLALVRAVEVVFKSQVANADLPALYGSELWLMKVFEECLQAAVRSTRDGGTLTIEHRQMGPRALIVFRDSGVFAANQAGTEAMPKSGQRRRGVPMDAQTFIGLRLSRQIVALHGGVLREENEDGVRNFLIDLPTGAPHRTEAGQLDVAQAQRYARDLSALMARARKKPAA